MHDLPAPGGITGANDLGLYCTNYHTGAVPELVREGQPLNSKTVKSFSVPKAAAGSVGTSRAFNTQHQVVLLVTFDDHFTAISASPCPTACPSPSSRSFPPRRGAFQALTDSRRPSPKLVIAYLRHRSLFLGSGATSWHAGLMSTVTIHMPDRLEAALADRVKTSGASSMEEYLLRLVEWDIAAESLDNMLTGRMNGPFAPLEEDWKDRVRNAAAKRVEA